MYATLLRRSIMFVILFTLLLITLRYIFAPIVTHAQSVPAAGTVPPPITPTWTTWGAGQYAVADDDDDFWIGTSGSIVRWHKQSQRYWRYSGVDGLPHRHVYAVAVDSAGNRWFGGDGGLSRLDSNELWTHFTLANSGLQSTLVDGIAVGADNTLWVSHGLPDGRISRRDPDGNWSWFPSRAATVVSDYARILQTQNQNPLWTVANGEAWVDFLVYDGTHWLDRTPDGVTEAPVKEMSAAGSVWALAGAEGYAVDLYQWQNGNWSGGPENPFYLSFNSYATSFAVAESGDVWFGYNYRAAPYTHNEAAIFKLGSDPAFFDLGVPVPIRAILTNDAGLWAVGPSWLRTPDGTVHQLTDTLVYPLVSDVVLDRDSTVWLNNYDVGLTYYSRGLLQNLKDFGTLSTNDDQWNRFYDSGTYHDIASAWERTPSGDLLSAWGATWRIGWWSAGTLRWDRQGSLIEVPLPYYIAGVVNDIFALDDHHFWLVHDDDFASWIIPTTDQHYLLAFDDKGTPSDFADDVWQKYTITSTGRGDALAVDSIGRLWYGNSEDLYRFNNGEWQPFSDDQYDVCDLTVDGEGSLYMLSWYEGHCAATNLITRIAPDNAEQQYYISTLIAERYFSLRSAPHRNKLWAVAPDGSIWYMVQRYSDPPSTTRSNFLERYDGSGVTSFLLPFTPETALQLEVDAYSNVWFVHDNQVWRMTQPPGFVLSAQPLNWQVEPGSVYAGDITLHSRDGYSGTVTLSALVPSNAISVTVAPERVAIGQSAKFTFTVAADSQPCAFALKLVASDAVLTQTTILSVTLRGADQNVYLPVVAR